MRKLARPVQYAAAALLGSSLTLAPTPIAADGLISTGEGILACYELYTGNVSPADIKIAINWVNNYSDCTGYLEDYVFDGVAAVLGGGAIAGNNSIADCKYGDDVGQCQACVHQTIAHVIAFIWNNLASNISNGATVTDDQVAAILSDQNGTVSGVSQDAADKIRAMSQYLDCACAAGVTGVQKAKGTLDEARLCLQAGKSIAGGVVDFGKTLGQDFKQIVDSIGQDLKDLGCDIGLGCPDQPNPNDIVAKLNPTQLACRSPAGECVTVPFNLPIVFPAAAPPGAQLTGCSDPSNARTCTGYIATTTYCADPPDPNALASSYCGVGYQCGLNTLAINKARALAKAAGATPPNLADLTVLQSYLTDCSACSDLQYAQNNDDPVNGGCACMPGFTPEWTAAPSGKQSLTGCTCASNQIAQWSDGTYTCGCPSTKLYSGGTCVSCPLGQIPNPTVGICSPCGQGAGISVDGTYCLSQYDCSTRGQVLTPVQATTPSGESFTAYQCQCPDGLTLVGEQCVPKLNCDPTYQTANYATGTCDYRCPNPGEISVVNASEEITKFTCKACDYPNSIVGDNKCLSCPAGTNADGARKNCVPICDPSRGYYFNPQPGVTSVCSQCNGVIWSEVKGRGSDYSITTTSCSPCPAGQVSQAGQCVPFSCPAGTTSDGGGNCVPICDRTKGLYFNTNDNQCEVCQGPIVTAVAGSSSGAVTTTSCLAACAAGQVVSADHQRCICKLGFVANDPSAGPGCHSCGPGTAFSGGACQSCPANTISQGGALDCTPCGANAFSNRARTACVCQAGLVRDNPSDPGSSCHQCQAGTVAQDGKCKLCAAGAISTAGSNDCMPCGANTFANRTRTACVCQPGTVQDNPGNPSSSCHQCAAGTVAQGGQCKLCPAGTTSTAGSNDCTPCGANMTSDPTRTTCVALTVPESGTGKPPATSCPPNSYQQNNTCHPCGPTALANDVAKTCTQCVSGFRVKSIGGRLICAADCSNVADASNQPANWATDSSAPAKCMLCPAWSQPDATHSSCTCDRGHRWNTSTRQCDMQCPGGTVPNQAHTSCVCPSGSTWNVSTKQCAPTGAPPQSPADIRVCAPGTQWNASLGRCIPLCPAGSVWNAERKACVAQPPPPGARIPTCPAGTAWNAERKACIALPARPSQIPTCPAGSVWNAERKACVAVTAPQACPAGNLFDASLGRCVAAARKARCTAGSTWSASLRRCITRPAATATRGPGKTTVVRPPRHRVAKPPRRTRAERPTRPPRVTTQPRHNVPPRRPSTRR
jgi:hypothetical protein